jgi:hypothetical protein
LLKESQLLKSKVPKVEIVYVTQSKWDQTWHFLTVANRPYFLICLFYLILHKNCILSFWNFHPHLAPHCCRTPNFLNPRFPKLKSAMYNSSVCFVRKRRFAQCCAITLTFFLHKLIFRLKIRKKTLVQISIIQDGGASQKLSKVFTNITFFHNFFI